MNVWGFKILSNCFGCKGGKGRLEKWENSMKDGEAAVETWNSSSSFQAQRAAALTFSWNDEKGIKNHIFVENILFSIIPFLLPLFALCCGIVQWLDKNRREMSLQNMNYWQEFFFWPLLLLFRQKLSSLWAYEIREDKQWLDVESLRCRNIKHTVLEENENDLEKMWDPLAAAGGGGWWGSFVAYKPFSYTNKRGIKNCEWEMCIVK